MQQVDFSDGTTVSVQQLVGAATIGTAGADTLYGTKGADTFDGLGAPAGSQDYEQGNGGGDTFVFDPGYGQLEVSEDAGYGGTSIATLQFGAGITAAQLTVAIDGSGNMLLTDGVAGDQIEIDGRSGSGDAEYGVAQVSFADGTVLTRQQLAAIATTGTSGADVLFGTSGPDIFDGMGAPAGSQDTEHGNGGADTFVFDPGYGQLEINEDAGYGAATTAVLKLGAGITPDQVAYAADGSGAMVLTGSTAGDQVRIDGFLNGAQYGVAAIQFADGTSLTRQQIMQILTTGTADADNLVGTPGDEVFDGKGAPAGEQDYERGNGGNDTFVFNAGYGQLEINEDAGFYATSTAVLQLGAGIDSSQIAAASDGAGNVVLTDGVTGDTVKIDGMMNAGYGGYAQYGIAEVQFSDGSTLDRQQILALTTTGTAGADVLYGTAGADTFDGKGAPAGSQDYEQGKGGADTFVFNAGYGQLEINENAGFYANSAAVLQLGPGITSSQIAAASDGAGSVVLTDGVTGDTVKIDGMMNAGYGGYAQYGIAEVQFSDGSTLDRQQILALTTIGTVGADVLYGTTGADTFDGKGAPAGSQDYEQGNRGADTFVFNAGYGQVEINEDAGFYATSAAVLQLGPGITSSQIAATSDSAGNVVLTDGVAGDAVKLDGMMNAGYGGYAQYGIAEVQFSDGSTLNRQQILALTTTGTAGADVLYGTPGADTFDGKGAPVGSQDYEQGAGGADTFVFNPGYGQLEINEDAGYDTNTTATLQLGAGITAADISATGDGSGNVTLTFGTAGDQVQIDGLATSGYDGYAQYGVGQMQFADGTAWTQSQIVALAGMGTSSADVIDGTAGNDIFDGRGGADVINGGGGYDTYLFRQSYGALTIDNSLPGGAAAQGEVDFGPGITEQNLWFSQSGTDLLATVLGSVDTVDIKGWFGSDSSAQLAAFKGYDGFKLDSQVGQLVTAMAAYAGDNPGFDPQTATAMPTNPALQSALAAAWHT